MPGGYAAAVDALGDVRNRPTAIVATCDEVAIGAIIAARRLGVQVPSDLSVIGIDDHEFADMFSLTTLRQSPREQGRVAVELLLDHLDDPSAADAGRADAVAAGRAQLDCRPRPAPFGGRRSTVASTASAEGDIVFDLPDSWVWDFWFADDGERYHLFFLYASRALHDPDRRHLRASIGHAVSDDLVSWSRVRRRARAQ